MTQIRRQPVRDWDPDIAKTLRTSRRCLGNCRSRTGDGWRIDGAFAVPAKNAR